MRKLFGLWVLLIANVAWAQVYPSPTFLNLTVNGTVSLPANTITNAFLAQAPAYTEKCNSTATTGGVSDCKRPNLNVEDFGVVGDGTTDNSANMATAIAACAALGGCTLHFSTKTGNGFVMHGVVVASSSIGIVCENSVNLINNSTNTYTLQFGNGSTTASNQSISGCEFGQKSGVTPTTGNTGLAANKVGSFHMHDVLVAPFPAALQVGVSWLSVSQSFMDGVNVLGSLSTGIILNGGSGGIGDIYISNSHSDANAGDGWDVTDTGGYFSAVTAYNNNLSGWNLFKTSVGNVDLFFSNCVGDTSGTYNWNVTSLREGYFSNSWGSTQQSTSVNTFATGFQFSGPGVVDVTMVNSTAINNNSHGIAIVNSGGMPQNISIVNPVAGDNRDGNGKASGGGYGIWVDNAASNIYVSGGEAINNATGAIFNNGTAATLRVSNVQGFTPSIIAAGSSAVSLTSTVNNNVATISLLPGTWDVSGAIQFVPAGSTVPTYIQACVSLNSAACTSLAGTGAPIAALGATMATGGAQALNTMPYRITVTVPTNVYLVGDAVFTVSTMTANAYLRAVPAP